MTPGPVVLDVRTASPHFPGIGRNVAGLARALARAARPWPLALLHGPRCDPRLPLGEVAGIACTSSPFQIAQQWEVRRRLRAHGTRLYHSPYYLMPVVPGITTVVTCYDLIPLTVRGLFDPARRFAFRAAHALAFRAAAAIVVPSDATARDVARVFPAHAAKIHVVPIGWEFEPAPASGAATGVEASGIDGPFVLSVGSNKPHKNLDVLIDAWSRVVDGRRGSPVQPRLVLAGPRDPRYRGRAAEADRLRRDGHLVTLGPVSDARLASLYRDAALFVLPSRAEGFGLPVLEAMAFGTPVVCSRIDALVELCGPSAAAFCPVDDAAVLAVTLDRLLDDRDERWRLQAAGRARAAAFGWDRAGALTLDLYQRLLNGRD
jgi:glycosyltransferase involved in cell wall biosynthesis